METLIAPVKPEFKILDSDSVEEKREKYSALFRYMRFDCLDELPDRRIVTGQLNDQLYKCRGGFITGLRNLLFCLPYDVPLPEEHALNVAIQDFVSYVKSLDFSQNVDRACVDKINEVLDKVLDFLSGA